MQEKERSKLLERKIYRYAFGPEDNSENIPSDQSAAPLEPGQRRKNTEYGQSIKIGCQAHFTVVVKQATPDLCEIRFELGSREHSRSSGGGICHGPDRTEPGLSQLAPRLSIAVKEKVANLLRRGVRSPDTSLLCT